MSSSELFYETAYCRLQQTGSSAHNKQQFSAHNPAITRGESPAFEHFLGTDLPFLLFFPNPEILELDIRCKEAPVLPLIPQTICETCEMNKEMTVQYNLCTQSSRKYSLAE